MLVESVAPEREAPSQRRPGRLDYIEGMRGVAALYVAIGHIFTMVDPYRSLQRADPPSLALAILAKPFWYGHLAVSAFIVLSGFCLQLSLYNRGDGRIQNLKKFAKRRCWRILPPYYACLVLSILVALFVTTRQYNFIQGDPEKLASNPDILPWSQYLPVTADNVAAHALLVQNLTTDWMYKINGVLWSISIEFQLYFLFPLFVWILFRKGRWALLAPTIAFAAILLALVPVSGKMYVWYMPLFALGMAAAQLAFGPSRDDLIERFRHCARYLTLAALASLVLTCIASSTTKLLWLSDSLFAVTVVSLLLLGTIRTDHWAVRPFGLRRVVWLGAFSYSLYLMHHPILQIVQAFRPTIVNTMQRQIGFLFLAGLPLVLTLCFAFYWVFERPFVSGKSHRTPRDEPVPGF